MVGVSVPFRHLFFRVFDRITRTLALLSTHLGHPRHDVSAASSMEIHSLVRDHALAVDIRLLGSVAVLETLDMVSAGPDSAPDLVCCWTRVRLTSQ